MGRSPCCDKQLGLKKGPWTPEEDKVLVDYIQANGHGSWRSLPKLSGLQRCGKSCRLRWTNYLRPDIKRGPFTQDEQKSIIQLHAIVGNKWSTIATQLPGRTDNEIKNYWNTHLKKRLLRMGINPETYAPSHISPLSTPASSTSSPASVNATSSSFSTARHMAQWESARLEAEARLSRESLLFSAASAASVATTSASTNAADQTNIDDKEKKEAADIFLRMWNSDVGDSFRKKNESNCQHQLKVTKDKSSPGASSSCNTKPSSALTVSEANAERREDVESEETSDETYQFYLDLAAGDDDLSLFSQSHQQLESCYSSLFSSDLNELSSLDNPFK